MTIEVFAKLVHKYQRNEFREHSLELYKQGLITVEEYAARNKAADWE